MYDYIVVTSNHSSLSFHVFFRKEADVGLGLFSVIEERMEIVEYSAYLGCDTFTILMKNAVQAGAKRNAIIAPFEWKVRGCVIKISIVPR